MKKRDLLELMEILGIPTRANGKAILRNDMVDLLLTKKKNYIIEV